MDTIFYTLTLSLFDSLSTTLQIIIFVLLLTTVNPLRNALSYLVGLSGAYFVCGFAGYFVIDELRALVNKFLPTQTMANPPYYLSEFLTGVVMVRPQNRPTILGFERIRTHAENPARYRH